MKDYDQIKVSVDGHTDSDGSDRFNLKLSKRRAASVRNYLIEQRIDLKIGLQRLWRAHPLRTTSLPKQREEPSGRV